MGMSKAEFLALIQNEIMSHNLDTFLTEEPSVAKGGKGVVTPGCPRCHEAFYNSYQLLRHIAYDAMPKLFGLEPEKKEKFISAGSGFHAKGG